ncbi:MAG: ABC transporter permease [Candidatus Eremiobacteraeota bacterium]|nr:ABC transporter permease [Candidatus Eremiobacteraeota bacterium]
MKRALEPTAVWGFGNAVGLGTLVKRELGRTLKVINQVVWPPIITTVLYVLVFGVSLGSRIPRMQGVSYAEYLVPGLIMLQVIDATYSEVSSSVFQGRFMNSIQEMLIAPLSAVEMVTGYLVAAIVRALGIATLVLTVAAFFAHAHPRDWVLYVAVTALVATLFCSLGIIFGLLAEKFDHIAVLTTFVITPLVFVGGVFTSTKMMPPLVREISLGNPMFYMIDAFRYAFTGTGDVPLAVSLGVLIVLTAAALALALRMTAIGVKLRL